MPGIGDTERAIVAAAVAFHNDMVRAFDERGQTIELTEVEAMYDDMNRQRKNIGWALMQGDERALSFGGYLNGCLLSTWRALGVMAERRAALRPQAIELPAWARP